jgi:transposase
MNTLAASQTMPQKKLLVAFELSLTNWKLAFFDGGRGRIRDIAAGDFEGLMVLLSEMKKKLGLPANAEVIACYEAGREGFSVQRTLTSLGVSCLVVDPSSIEVDRRARRAKTDRIYARKLLALLARRELLGESPMRVVHAPSVEDEDRRQISRERAKIVSERTSKWNELKGLLFAQGISVDASIEHGLTREDLDAMTTSDKRSLPTREEEASSALKLMWIRGVGQTTADVFAREFFDWRDFKNGREVGSCAGLAPSPWASGNTKQTQGISKAGNARVRTMALELAQRWVKHQPNSELAAWFTRRSAGGKRQARVAVVALARKLLVALWHYLKDGTLPAGVKLHERITITSH